MSESQRGCGYRKIGGLYLVSDPGFQLVCDGLPMKLEPCQCCGFEPLFSRNLQRIQAEYISQAEDRQHEKKTKEKILANSQESLGCSCPPECPICNAITPEFPNRVFGLMYVGIQGYTPESFIKEAVSMGISKRIPQIPRWLKLDETWIMLAHKEVPKTSLEIMKQNWLHTHETTRKMLAIFYAFKPQRVEMPIWKGDLSNAEIRKLEEQGITPVILDSTPENKMRHKEAITGEKRLEKYLEDHEE